MNYLSGETEHERLRTRGEKLVIATTVSLLLALVLALIPSLAQPAYAKPYCDSPTPPPICDRQDDPQPPPSRSSNDNFSAARALSESLHWDSGTTTKATLEVGEPSPYHPTQDCGIFGVSNSVWYKVTPDFRPDAVNSGTLEATTEGSSLDTVLALYKGSSLSSLQQVACSNDNSIPNWNDHMWAPVSEGQTYYLQLAGTGGARAGAYELNVNLHWQYCYSHSHDQSFCALDSWYE